MKSEEASFCFQCGGLWCNACRDAHSILRAHRDHRLLALKDFQEKDYEAVLERPAFCQKKLHEKEVLNFYCKLCEIPVCQNCVTVEHHQHDVEYLEITAKAAKFSIAAQLEAAEKETQDFSECLRGLEEKSRKIEQRFECVKRQIRDAVKSLIQKLQAREQALIAEVEKEAKIEQNRIRKSIAKIRDHLNKTEDSMSRAKHFIDCSTAAELVRAEAFMNKLLKELPAAELATFTCERESLQSVFVENKAISESLKNTGIGCLEKTTTRANRCTVESFEEANVGFETRFKLITRNADGNQSYFPFDSVVVELTSTNDRSISAEVKTVDRKNGSYEVSCIPNREGELYVTVRVNGEPISERPVIHAKKRSYKLVQTVGGKGTGALVLNDENEIIVCEYWNHRIQVFDGNGNLVRTIEHELLSEPTGVCTDSADRIYVAAKNKILLFNSNGEYVKEIFDKENQDVHLNRISLDEQGNIIVTNRDDDTTCVCKAVHILSPEGKFLKKISRDNFSPFDCLYYDGKIFVSNWATQTINVFDCEGNLLDEIGTQGNCGNREFTMPTGLAVDKSGHLFVADLDRVQEFTLDGMFVSEFGGDVLPGPRGVSVLGDGRVIVTDCEKDQVLIFG